MTNLGRVILYVQELPYRGKSLAAPVRFDRQIKVEKL
jgi:hypothetical protein